MATLAAACATSSGGGQGGASTTSTSSTSHSSAQTSGGGQGGAPAGVCPDAGYGGQACTPGAQMMVPFCEGEANGSGASSGGLSVCEVDPSNMCNTIWNPPCEPTPLVLSFDGSPVRFGEARGRRFALDATRDVTTDWPSAATPWLALDRDGSGAIEDGSELFGSMTRLSSGRRATNGFEALRELDANGDGKLTAADPGFAKLMVWADRDGDRVSTRGELTSVASARIVSIDVDFTTDPRCDARGNCEVERARFTYTDASGALRTGEIIDVHLRAQR